MRSLGVGGFTEDQVKAALHAGNRVLDFRYDLLNLNNTFLAELDSVQGASVAHNSLAEIKRTAKFSLKDTGAVDYLSHRIQPWFRLKMAGDVWIEWPLGIFLLSTPARNIGPTSTTREVDAYDQTVVLVDDQVEDRYAVLAGTNVIAAVATILAGAGFAQHNLVSTDQILPVDMEWSPGTTKLRIINDLLAAINYWSLTFSSEGKPTSKPYQRPDIRGTEYTYSADSSSVLKPGVDAQLDLFKVPNKWVAHVSEPDRPPLKSVYTNTNPSSPTSTVSRGRTIVEVLDSVEATSQAVLDDLVVRAAVESSQVFEQVTINTGLMPHHEDSDLIALDYDRYGPPTRFVEHGWEMPLGVGQQMTHRLRRVVSV